MASEPDPSARLEHVSDELRRAFAELLHAVTAAAIARALGLGDDFLDALAREPGRISEAAAALRELAAAPNDTARFAKRFRAAESGPIDFSDIENTEPGEACR
jgi:gamma-glutamyl phosphate reductase